MAMESSDVIVILYTVTQKSENRAVVSRKDAKYRTRKCCDTFKI